MNISILQSLYAPCFEEPETLLLGGALPEGLFENGYDYFYGDFSLRIPL